MYNEHFGLTQAPFRITPDTGLFYTGGGRGDVLEALVYAVTSGEGIVKVVGEVGTGKTMLCRMLEERLPDNVQIAYLANPSLTPEDILHAVALELGLDLEPSTPRLQVMHRLQLALLERHAQNRRVVALVEEAQSMPVDTLEEIRLLSNLETKNEKLLQIILFGQPELDDNLARPEIRQLRERITHSFQLKPLGGDEIKDYVAFRLRASGYRGRDAFSRDAYRAMSRASEGLTRRVNIIADKAMLAAFAEDTHDVSARHVKVAIQDSEFGAAKRPARTARPVLVLAGVAAAAAVLAGGVGWYAGNRSGAERWETEAVAMGGDGDSRQAPRTASSVAVVAHDGGAGAVQSARTGPEAGSQTSRAGELAGAVVSAARAATPAADPSAVTHDSVTGGTQRTDPDPPVVQTARAAPAVVSPVSVETPPTAERVPVVSSAAVANPESAAPTDRRTVGAAVETAATEMAALPQDSAKVSSPSVAASAVSTAPEAPVPESVSGGTPERQPDAPAPTVAAPSAPTAVASAAPAKAREPEKAAAKAVSDRSPVQRRGSSESLLDQRLEETQAWLRRVNGKHYSIQLLATDASQRGNLEAFLQQRDRAGHLGQVFVYRTRISARNWFGVLFGEFASFSEAREALNALPVELTRHQPFIRNIRDISVLG